MEPKDLKLMVYTVFILLVTAIIMIMFNGPKSLVHASERSSTIDRRDCAFVKITFEGHDYLALNFNHNGYFTHSESCPCKKGNLK